MINFIRYVGLVLSLAVVFGHSLSSAIRRHDGNGNKTKNYVFINK